LYGDGRAGERVKYEKIPRSRKKVLQTKNLPLKIAKITKTVSA
jgi:hypothetical protein